jgi:ribose-phosphate pyrophosphokinase
MKGVINLHKGFTQDGTEIEVKLSTFPGGEVYVKTEVPNWCSSVRINSRFHNNDDFMRIALTVDSLRRQGIYNISLFIPYLPYSRQDRVCRKGESFSLKVICQLLKSCQFTNIYTYDNHSNVASVLLDNLVDYDNHTEVKIFMDKNVLQDVTLVVPDQGAAKKAGELYREIDNIKEIVYANKTRIGSCIVLDKISVSLKGKTCLVVDDICDGGATFEALSKRMDTAGARKKYLFVSHGIFSKGFKLLNQHYERIGTTNSILDFRLEEDCDVFPITY